MKHSSTVASLAFLLVLSMTACASPTPQPSSTGALPPVSKKQIVATVFSNPAGLHLELTNPSTGSTPGVADLYQMLDGSFTYLDPENVRQPLLVEGIPAVDKGTWQVFPDGRMETTWRIKPGTRWHDGSPVTVDDVRFTFDVYRARDLGIAPVAGLALVTGVDDAGPQTVVVNWQKPFIDADLLLGLSSSSAANMRLLPQHLLERPFRENRESFLGLPYWRDEFVGAGSFRVSSWDPASGAMLSANDQYVLGRPRIDQIEVRFYTDLNAIKAGLLAGTVDAHLGRGFSVDDVVDIHNRTQAVKVQLGGTLSGLLPVWPQLMDPDPPIVANVQFRRALLMAIDRQEMTEAINSGIGQVGHSWVQPDRPEGRAIEPKLVRYPYDPRAASQMIEALGYTKAADGGLRGTDGSKLSFELRTSSQPLRDVRRGRPRRRAREVRRTRSAHTPSREHRDPPLGARDAGIQPPRHGWFSYAPDTRWLFQPERDPNAGDQLRGGKYGSLRFCRVGWSHRTLREHDSLSAAHGGAWRVGSRSVRPGDAVAPFLPGWGQHTGLGAPSERDRQPGLERPPLGSFLGGGD